MPWRPPRDSIPQAETDALMGRLREQIAAARRRHGATVIHGPGAQLVRVRIDGAQAGVDLVEGGVVLAARDLDTAELLAVLEERGQTFGVLAEVAGG